MVEVSIGPDNAAQFLLVTESVRDSAFMAGWCNALAIAQDMIRQHFDKPNAQTQWIMTMLIAMLNDTDEGILANAEVSN